VAALLLHGHHCVLLRHGICLVRGVAGYMHLRVDRGTCRTLHVVAGVCGHVRDPFGACMQRRHPSIRVPLLNKHRNHSAQAPRAISAARVLTSTLRHITHTSRACEESWGTIRVLAGIRAAEACACLQIPVHRGLVCPCLHMLGSLVGWHARAVVHAFAQHMLSHGTGQLACCADSPAGRSED
jgi:hypothetical protein